MTKLNSKHTNLLKINSETKNLLKVRNFVKHNSINYGFDDKSADELVIAVDEACTNIIKHGLNYDSKEELEIKIYKDFDYLAIDITDNAPSFDLRDFESIELESHINSYKKNGLGIYMIRSYVDSIEYKKYENGTIKNILTLKKHLPK
jgi:anti-sigma regulatory factor (Ser/Thr protein kinase)